MPNTHSKKTVRSWIMILGLLLIWSTTPLVLAQDAPTPEAATQWVTLIDTEQYGESWKQAAPYFQSALTQEAWQHSLRAHRIPLGKPLSRTLRTQTIQTSLPGMPNGRYAIFYFHSRFEHKEQAQETLVMMQVPGNRWKAVGYTIQ